MQPAQTGGFLRGAASTALGVAGGALLFQGINSMFSGNHGLTTGALAGTPTESLTEKTVPNADAGYQQADFGGDAADFGGDEDFGGDDDYA